MGEDEYDQPINLGDRSSAPLKQSSTLEPERSGQEEDDATATTGGKSSRTDGQTTKEK